MIWFRPFVPYLQLKTAYFTLKRLAPWLLVFGVLLSIIGTVSGLFIAPADYQQKDAFRIIYIHVPFAIWSMGLYSVLALMSLVFLIWRTKISQIIARAAAPAGALMTFLALLTGAIWGKPMWGTWWIWDARLSSELLLLFIYLAYLGLGASITERHTADRIMALFAVFGFANIPIIHFSVVWWNTLHQGATITRFARPAISNEMLWPLLVMIVAIGMLMGYSIACRACQQIAKLEIKKRWMEERNAG